MKFLLDTNTCIYLIKKKPPSVIEKLHAYQVGDVGISVVTVAELRYGVAKSQRIQQNQGALDLFLAPFEIVVFDENTAATYGEIRAQLEKTGQPIDTLDLLIAAHAKSLSVTLVTNNIGEFKRVKGLKVETWTS